MIRGRGFIAGDQYADVLADLLDDEYRQPHQLSISDVVTPSDAGTVACGGPTTAVPATSAGGLGPAPSGAALPAATPAGSPSTHEEATAPADTGPVA